MAKEKLLEVTSKYIYNREGDNYVIPMKHRVKPFVISGYKVRAIRKAISNSISASETASDICIKYRLQIEDFDALKKAFDLSRDTFPLTDEEVEEDSIECNREKLLEERRTTISQEFEKEEWKETLKDATQWRKFVNKQYDPFASALDNWIPPKVKAFKVVKSLKAKNTLVVGLSDLHWGCSANAKYMYNDKGGWDSNKTTKAVDAYCQSIINLSKERSYKFDKVEILLLGDILHSVSGKTSRGTELKYDIIREEMFELAMTSLSRFFSNLCSNFKEIEVRSVGGNHNYEAETALYRALEAYFRTVKNIKFNNYTTRPAAFKIKNTLFLLDHGQSSEERAYVPLGENKLESHVQNLLLQKPHNLQNINSKVFVMGDRHNFKHLEFDNFDFIMFSTILGADEHASTNNWANRARQNCLVIDEFGIKEVIHFYVNSLLEISKTTLNE